MRENNIGIPVLEISKFDFCQIHNALEHFIFPLNCKIINISHATCFNKYFFVSNTYYTHTCIFGIYIIYKY